MALASSFAEEPTSEKLYQLAEVDWSDPDVVAYMDPDVICPFSVEIYPPEFSQDDVVFLKLQFENTLDMDAYALADERHRLVLGRQVVNATLELGDDILIPLVENEYNEESCDERPLFLWRKLSPGEKCRTLYLLH